MRTKPKLLILCDWFAPGYKAGGPIRSLVNMSLALKGDYDINVLTGDRDLGEKLPYKGVEIGQWNAFAEHVNVYYLPENDRNFSSIKKCIEQVDPDVFYLNSMFSVYFTLVPLVLKMLFFQDRGHWVLNTRGMLKKSAVSTKRMKKELFFALYKLLRWQYKVVFHFTDSKEADDAMDRFGRNIKFELTGNFPTVNTQPLAALEKSSGQVDLLFVGRIHPIKNLKLLLEVLTQVKATLNLCIIGYKEDENYWRLCQEIIKKLPEHIKVEYLGEVEHQRVFDYIRKNHFLILPTMGENFGHAIFDALALGRPVIISDNTPWRGLAEAKVGWDLSLDDPDKFIRVVTTVAAMEQKEYDEWSYSAYQYAKDYLQQNELISDYKRLFSK